MWSKKNSHSQENTKGWKGITLNVWSGKAQNFSTAMAPDKECHATNSPIFAFGLEVNESDSGEVYK